MSNRIREQRRIMDDAARQRRARKALEKLEYDNFNEDPHADLVMSKKAMNLFQDDDEDPKKSVKRKTRREDYFKHRYRKNFSQLLEEDSNVHPDTPNYIRAQAPPSAKAPRRFCAVCGDFYKYTCSSCGAYYCSIRCEETHRETRCLKWTV
ncbi:zinc finger HIT domain-containing protein 1 isoform X3 [Lepeophtheirus salmonis]|uniref:zinc finger HIT domain-containing protein 1 isoform X3 n=1 Tax=Lepeophtheirus salmonis TaxID=72036 RepID=UPI001AE5E471|nr:zinc finger HIT domain-containing protein 1-like [Lepeophtheirus salmonis]